MAPVGGPIGQSISSDIAMQQQSLAQNMAVNDIGQQSALYMGQMAINMAAMEAEGTAAQLQLNQISTAANIQADLAMMSTKNTLLLTSKAQEMSLLVAQYREKTLQMFMSITDQKTQTVWGRMKQMIGGFKF